MRNSGRLLLISAIAGSGHRVTAEALKSILQRQYTVKIVPIHRILGVYDLVGELFYNYCLLHRKIRLVEPLHMWVKFAARMYRPFLLLSIKKFFEKSNYTCIVSCVPWINHYIIRVVPHIPLVTVITDFSNSSNHPWIQHRKQILICPTTKSAEQARSFGIPEENIFPVSGNIISPVFYAIRGATIDRKTELKNLGLDPELKTALVLYGGFGPDYIEKLVYSIDGWNFIVIWGKNKKRVEKANCLNVGFTGEIPRFMMLSDVLVGKPGPGVVAEAVHCALPIIVDAGRDMVLPQEEDVLEWILASDIGTSFRSLAEFKRKMSSLQERDVERWRINAGKIENNAIFEAIDVIESVVDGVQ